MVEQNDISRLLRQIRAALLNKPITEDMKTECAELRELQEALEYLIGCLNESNEFLSNLCAGQLNAEAPGRHNFLAGQLKELHSILRHLTWQTAQVANGDYSQQVRFLGEFSDSFNIMIRQLKEREISLSAKSNALAQSMNLLKSVLDGLREWVVVIDEQDKKVIYVNLSAKRKFYNVQKETVQHEDFQELLELIIESNCQVESQEYNCRQRERLFLIRSFPIEWGERQAIVHCISDITHEREEKEQLQNMAYRDMLTNAYNRRYCIEKITALLEKEVSFSLVLIDLDGLKAVNDGLGHNAGDDYILTVSGCLMENFRAETRLCRIGGDEFVLLFPKCSEKNAEKKMKRVVQLLDEREKAYKISVSYGIVFVEEGCETTPEDLFNLADVRMYVMKKTHKE